MQTHLSLTIKIMDKVEAISDTVFRKVKLTEPQGDMVSLEGSRPLGVTILAVLASVSGVLSLLGGITLIALGPMMAPMIAKHGTPGMMGAFSGFMVVMGVIVLVVGILNLIVAWGYWTGQGWAWVLGAILGVIGVIMGTIQITSGGIIGLILNAIILYYLFQPHVKEYFGRT